MGDQHRGHKNRWWTKPEQGKGTRKEKGKELTQKYIYIYIYIYICSILIKLKAKHKGINKEYQSHMPTAIWAISIEGTKKE